MYSSSPDEMRAAAMRDDPVVCILGDEEDKGACSSFQTAKIRLVSRHMQPSRQAWHERGIG
jgi:type IV secretory pathway VirJ component